LDAIFECHAHLQAAAKLWSASALQNIRVKLLSASLKRLVT